MVNWKELRKKPKLVPYAPPFKDIPEHRSTKRNRLREARQAAVRADRVQPKKPRPQQEPVIHELPPKREPKTRDPLTGKFSKSPHAPTYVSHSGYRSKQKRQCALNKKLETRSHAKSHRIARQSRNFNRKKERARRKALDR